MKGQIILAEAATAHPDGTLSMLRAGITHVWSPTPPYSLVGSLVLRFLHELGDEGTHQFDLVCLGQDGERILPQVQGQFDAAKGGGVANVILGLNVAFQKTGRFVFVLRVDNVQVADLTLTTMPAPEQPK